MCLRNICSHRQALFTSRLVAAVLNFLLAVNVQAQAFNLLEDSFTQVRMDFEVPYLVSSSSSPDLSRIIESTLNGATTVSFTANEPQNYSLGEISGYGHADFTSLGASFEMTGSSAREALVIVTSHDVLTIAPPTGVSVGTPGSMTLVYQITGATYRTIHLGASPAPGRSPSSSMASFGIGARTYGEDPGTGALSSTSHGGYSETTLSYSDAIAYAAGDVFAPTQGSFIPTATIEVPFVYGEPLPLEVSFSIRGETDRTDPSFIFNPYGEQRGERLIGDLSMDFSNTAALIAIVNEEHPTTMITGVNHNYSSLVTATIPNPVPVPPAVWLFASALGYLLHRTRKSRRTPSEIAKALANRGNLPRTFR